jgi:DNA polymerase-3 subunit gamma/tau
MRKFVVSARKYRPTRFDEVVGQEHVSQTLKNALKNEQLAHAFLFCGPRGVGKTTCARILAKVINCENPTQDFEACNTCSSCVAFNQNASFNITELDAASNNSVEHIRTLIEQVRFQPQQGQYKVFIIDEVHMLSSQAFNAFLKTLEEPPPYAIFILATTEKHKIIPTILSRCQIFDFRRIQAQDIVPHLQSICEKEGVQADSDALHIIAQKADGALRDALSIFDRMLSFSGKEIRYQTVIDSLNILDYDYFFKITDSLLSEDYPTALTILNDIIRKGFAPDIFINGLAAHFRDLLVCKYPSTLELLEVSDELKNRYQAQAHIAPQSFLLNALQLAHDADINFKTAVNKRLHIELALLKMTYINRLTTAVQAPVETADEKKKSEQPLEPINHQKTSNTLTTKTDDTITETNTKSVRNEPPIPDKPKENMADQTKSPAQTSPKNEQSKLSNLDKLLHKHKTLLSQEKIQPKEPLKLETVIEAWNKYIETLQSKSAASALQNAKISVIDESKVKALTGSTIFLNLIKNEHNLRTFLQNQLNRDDLTLEVSFDESLAMEESPEDDAPKPLTPKEKFEKMMEINPLINDLRKRLELSLEKD